MSQIEFDSAIMKWGSTCQTCFNAGIRGKQSRIRYKAKPCSCVRCKIGINARYYEKNKEKI